MRLLRSPSCLSVSNKYILKQLVDFHKIEQGDHFIEVGLDSILILNMTSVTVMMWIFSLQHLVNLSFVHKVNSII